MLFNILLNIVIILGNISLIRYILYLFVAPIHAIQSKKIISQGTNMQREDLERNFLVSVIVPAWNEEVGIINSIKSLLKNNYNNLEIIVVDDGSTDNTAKIVREFKRKELSQFIEEGKTFKFISKKNGGKGSALNAGIKASIGDIIVTMDADTEFETDAIYNAVKYFGNDEIDAVVGNVKVSANKNIMALIQQMEYTVGFYFKRVYSVFNSEYIIGGAFGVFRRKIFEEIGFFDELCKTEDIEFSTRIKCNGFKIIYAEDAIAYTEGASSFKGLCKQRLRWKKGRLDTFMRYSQMLFSMDTNHSKFLTFFIMPYAFITDFLLLIEPIFIVFVLYSVLLNGMVEYLMAWISFVTFILGISYLFGSKKSNNRNIVLIPLFYFFQFILISSEIYAIIGSLILYYKNQDVVWQSWNRKGVGNV